MCKSIEVFKHYKRVTTHGRKWGIYMHMTRDRDGKIRTSGN